MIDEQPPLTPEQIAENRQNALNANHYPSWVWDEAAVSYVPPIPYPTDGNPCLWDEDTLSWTPFPDYPVN
jgi:hypothetical protein